MKHSAEGGVIKPVRQILGAANKQSSRPGRSYCSGIHGAISVTPGEERSCACTLNRKNVAKRFKLSGHILSPEYGDQLTVPLPNHWITGEFGSVDRAGRAGDDYTIHPLPT
jgi:hypothetical protein